jgi:hypothetical protein
MIRPLIQLVMAAALAVSVAVIAEETARRTEHRQLEELSREIARDVERLRGWTFQDPVPTSFVARHEVTQMLLKELAQEYPDELLRADEAFFKMVGILPHSHDLKADLLDIMTSQIGGYYDPKDKTFHIVEDLTERYGPLPLAVVIAHELTHALDDQRFDLKKLMDSAGKDEDRMFAVTAMGEGSATVLMNRYLVERLEQLGSAAVGLAIFSAVSLMQDRESMEMLMSAPRYYQTLVARYTAGEAFMRYGAIYTEGETETERHAAALARAAEDLPQSSEQILHPAKYWRPEHRDDPVLIDSADVRSLLEQVGLNVSHEQTAGELLCAIVTQRRGAAMDGLTADQWTNPAAAGWGGDRFYLVGSAGEQTPAGIWFTLWDTPQDRTEFLNAYRGGRYDLIEWGDRGAVLLFNIDAAAQRLLRNLLMEHPPEVTQSGKPWPHRP